MRQALRVQEGLAEAYAQHDAKTYERWTAPEFVRVTTSGQVIPREQWLKNNMVENSGQAGFVGERRHESPNLR